MANVADFLSVQGNARASFWCLPTLLHTNYMSQSIPGSFETLLSIVPPFAPVFQANEGRRVNQPEGPVYPTLDLSGFAYYL